MRKKLWCFCLALAILGLQSGCAWLNQETVTVGGRTVVVDSSIPGSTLNAADFSIQKDGTITYAGGKYLAGIDASAHQGKINWKKVAKKVDFAMIRMGYRGYKEGVLVKDSMFAYNLKHAVKNGVKVGVYFFSQAITPEEAKEEANYLLTLIKDYDVTMNVAYDWEYIDNVEPGTARTETVTEDTVTQCAAAFCAVIREAGYEPAIYCNGMLGYLSYDLAQLPGIDIWYADYNSSSPNFAYQIRMWQYSDSATLDGVNGKVDLNLYFCDNNEKKE